MRRATPILRSAHSTTETANFGWPHIGYASLGSAKDEASIFAVEDVSHGTSNHERGNLMTRVRLTIISVVVLCVVALCMSGAEEKCRPRVQRRLQSRLQSRSTIRTRLDSAARFGFRAGQSVTRSGFHRK